MQKINTKWTFGNYEVSLTANVDDKQLVALAAAGLTQVAQRGPSSKAEKQLAGYDKRPAGFKRDSIEYTQENAEVLKEVFQEMEIAADVILRSHVEVSEYVPAENVVSKFTEEKVIIANHVEAGDLETWAKAKAKFDGSLTNDDGSYTTDFLLAVRKLKLAAYAAIKL